jgi:hypothetical protein
MTRGDVGVLVICGAFALLAIVLMVLVALADHVD